VRNNADLQNLADSLGGEHRNRCKDERPPPGRVEQLEAHYAAVTERAAALLKRQKRTVPRLYRKGTGVLEMISADEGDRIVDELLRDRLEASAPPRQLAAVT
jgi:hypothetical protein